MREEGTLGRHGVPIAHVAADHNQIFNQDMSCLTYMKQKNLKSLWWSMSDIMKGNFKLHNLIRFSIVFFFLLETWTIAKSRHCPQNLKYFLEQDKTSSSRYLTANLPTSSSKSNFSIARTIHNMSCRSQAKAWKMMSNLENILKHPESYMRRFWRIFKKWRFRSMELLNLMCRLGRGRKWRSD